MSWDACTNTQNAILHWMECHPGTASYVQAVGVILTVAGAIVGPTIKSRWAAFQARREEIRNAKQFARSAKVDVEHVIALINERLEIAESIRGQGASFEAVCITIPPRLIAFPGFQRYPKLWELNSVFELGDMLMGYNSALMAGYEKTDKTLSDFIVRQLTTIKAKAADVRYTIYGLG